MLRCGERCHGSQIDEGGGHLAPVAKLDGAFAEAAAGDDGDGVGGAAVDLDEGDETLAVWTAFGVVDAEALAAEHGQADAEDLAGAEMAVGNFGFAEESVEGLHGLMILLWFRLAGSTVAFDEKRGESGEIIAIARSCTGGVVFDVRGDL